MIRKFFGYLYLIYAGLMFGLTFLIVLFPIGFNYIFKEPRRSRINIHIYYWWMKIYLSLIFCKVNIKGRENFRKGKTYMVVANHRNFVDVMLTSPFIPGPNKTLAKKELDKIPIFNIVYRAGGIMVDRKDPESRRNSVIAMKNFLSMGIHVCLFPEGSRNKSKAPLGEFKDGAFSIAREMEVDVIPSVILNTSKVLPSKKLYLARPAMISLHFLPPIISTNFESTEALKNHCRQIMWDYIESQDQ